ncbi:MAG: DNA mismatch repair endonuclease MutL [Chitinophagales bacterium]|nr:DNA mismatch repair endonuclease MutL [Chitinophagales bacterium]MDW8419928.1 DNA mismatch repair endonuclease MutL [Chitinophagales bacterium]
MDLIRLLPDSIANQIAAGEVIQRPASAVKELLENSIDAGSTQITLLIKNSGKTLIQVIDNGCGMSETDARMCFEKHATSKIRTAEDLFNIRTMGFRGEALASIAAIAQVELKTRLHNEQLGTRVEIEGMKVTAHEPCQTPAGTSISVKNLFYNVPARRNFLKSDTAELRHILEEFQRIALAYPKVGFRMFNNDSEIYHLKPGNLRQRICALFGDEYDSRIVPVEEKSYALHVYGFAGKPEFSKKTRGEQFIFVNRRYIKSPYLNHAVSLAYQQLLPKDTFPFYVLFIDIDPSKIDVNVHPAKYEVKFEDEKLVYTFVNLGIKHAMGAYSIAPTLDFNQEHHFNRADTFGDSPYTNVEITQHATQPRQAKRFAPPTDFHRYTQSPQRDNPTAPTQEVITQTSRDESLIRHISDTQDVADRTTERDGTAPAQIHRRYILSQIKSGIILIDQQLAHERILYERYLRLFETKKHATQTQLFPQTLCLQPADAQVMKEILPEINKLGFDIQEFGTDTFIIHGMPADIGAGGEKKMIEELLELYKMNASLQLSKRENLARSLAHSSCIKHGRVLSTDEMKSLINELFACENPYHAPNGKRTFVTITLEELAKRIESGK